MKTFIYLTCLFILFLPLSITAVSEVKNAPSPQQLAAYDEDVTGDSQKESITLKGVLFSRETDYFRDVWVEIRYANKKQKIHYKGGYNPDLQFIDLNHDQVNDIFYQSATGGSGGLYNYHLHTLRNGHLKELPLPKQRYVEGQFQDNFKVTVQIVPKQKPYIVNVKDRASDYIQMGIYKKDGKLVKKMSAMVDPIAFYEPVLISKSKGYGLKSYQQISGAYHADQLGTVETVWYYENGSWIILQTDFVSSRK